MTGEKKKKKKWKKKKKNSVDKIWRLVPPPPLLLLLLLLDLRLSLPPRPPPHSHSPPPLLLLLLLPVAPLLLLLLLLPVAPLLLLLLVLTALVEAAVAVTPVESGIRPRARALSILIVSMFLAEDGWLGAAAVATVAGTAVFCAAVDDVVRVGGNPRLSRPLISCGNCGAVSPDKVRTGVVDAVGAWSI